MLLSICNSYTQGYVPGILGTSHGAVQFMVYEELKKGYCNFYKIPISTQLVRLLCPSPFLLFCSINPPPSPPFLVLSSFCPSSSFVCLINLQGALEYITMAAISKVVAVSATYPYQVVRARLQVR